MMAFEMIRLDRTAREPLHQQLYRQIRDELVSTNGNDGAARLPSSRSLAGDLGISRLTVNLAFSKLTTEGYLRSQIGSGTFVAHPLPENFLSAQKPRYARAIERLDVAVDDLERASEESAVDPGRADERTAAVALAAANEQLAAREAWVKYIEHGY